MKHLLSIFLAGLGLVAASAFAAGAVAATGPQKTVPAKQPAAHGRKLATTRSALSTTEAPNTWNQITTYNNFYEYESRAGAGDHHEVGRGVGEQKFGGRVDRNAGGEQLTQAPAALRERIDDADEVRPRRAWIM